MLHVLFSSWMSVFFLQLNFEGEENIFTLDCILDIKIWILLQHYNLQHLNKNLSLSVIIYNSISKNRKELTDKILRYLRFSNLVYLKT